MQADPGTKAGCEGPSETVAAVIRRAGEPDRETLRRRAAHAGPIHDHTLVYRVEFHALP